MPDSSGIVRPATAMNPPPHPASPISPGRRLGAGFALLIVLMIALVAHAVWHIRDLEQRMHTLAEVRNRTIQLATDLQEASYNLHNALVYQALATDPFERDDNFQLYNRWVFQVGKARAALKEMALDDFERDNLARQDPLVHEIAQMHETVIDLAARGDRDLAQDQLAVVLRPLNLRYTEMVDELRRHARDRITEALADTRDATRQAITLHLTLGGLLLALALLISIVTSRLLKRHTETILGQMAALEEAASRLEHQANHDPLTGLANRALFYRRLEDAIVHAGQEDFSLAVMYVDLDDFKLVNDTHGHAMGDALLREVADRLRRVVRVADTVARLGGDEFAVLLMGIDKTTECPELCDKIEQAVTEPFLVDGIALSPACSIGHAIFPKDGDSLDNLLASADTHMYQVKRARKGDRGEAG